MIIKASTPADARDRIAEFILQLASARRSDAIRTSRKRKSETLRLQAEDLEFIARKITAMEFTDDRSQS